MTTATTPTPTTMPWYGKHDNLVLLTALLAETGHDAKGIAVAVEKPWNYEDQFRAAWAVAKHERDTQHTVLHDWAGLHYCGATNCAWEFDEDQGHVEQCASLQHGYSDIAGSYDVGDLPCDCGTDAGVSS